MRVALVHNPSSGDCDADADGRQLIATLESAGHEVAYYPSKGDWRALLLEPSELIAVAGGDGTIREIVSALPDEPVPLAVLPMGTANNIARALGVADVPIETLVAGWRDAELRHFDIGACRGPWGSDLFLESVGAGVLSETMSEIDHGESGYVNDLDRSHARVSAALEVFERVARNAAPLRCRLRLDERELEGDYLLVEIMNFGAAGPNLPLSASADPSDGVFDVVLIEPRQRTLLCDFAAARRDGRTPPPLPFHAARTVHVTCTGGALHVDDQVWHDPDAREHRFEAVLRPAALHFLVPRASAGAHVSSGR